MNNQIQQQVKVKMKTMIMVIIENHEKRDPADINMAKQLLLEKMIIFKMMRENECADGKQEIRYITTSKITNNALETQICQK